MSPIIRFKKLDKRVTPPIKATEFSVGWDLSLLDHIRIIPREVKSVALGISVEIPEGFFGALLLRSSLGKRGLIIPNGMGVIDSDYRGEIGLLLSNITEEYIYLFEGERVAQLLILPYHPVTFLEVEKLSVTKRGSGGFGSTGK